MVKPGAVFLSNSTELGTVYTRSELANISKLCRNHGLYLYMDGARLGPALTSKASDLSFSGLNRLLDIYYIGGTKNGALMGEAIVINHSGLQGNLRYHLKQRGALLAKGRFIGAQFLCLFEKDRFLTLSRHANAMADKMAQQLARWGYAFLAPPETNQIFPILQNDRIARLQKLYGFYIWKKMDDKFSAIRIVTSWATKEAVVNDFLTDFHNLCM
jgi:threonine aldolase